jgi:hypothetical protein
MQHADWVLIILIALLFYWIFTSIRRARVGRQVYVRRIPGVDAIDNALGRATEMGRPAVYTLGEADVQSMETYASLGILSYIAARAARYGVKLIATVLRPQIYPMIEETMRDAYRSVERLDDFSEANVRFLSPDAIVYAMLTAYTIESEDAASAFFLGTFSFTSLLMTEPGNRRGVIQIAGDTNTGQMPFFVASCDYTIIGEELFAASAYVSDDPTIKGSLVAQDRIKLVLLAIIILGIIILSLSSWIPALSDSAFMEVFRRYQ